MAKFRNVGLAALIGHDVAVLIHLDARRDQVIIGDKADEDEHPVRGQVPEGPGLGVFQDTAATPYLGLDLCDHGIPKDVDFSLA